ncbi:MAG: hypothetical protein IPL79_03010 [Myxococcales bacterium]|nr:hypothetical protein [Myxococcales bacterium]
MPPGPPDNLSMIRRVLGDGYVALALVELGVVERPGDGVTKVNVVVKEGALEVAVHSEGVGLVDAVFQALHARYAPEYQSLSSIALVGFAVSTAIESGRGIRTDATCTVTIDVTNSMGRRFTFQDTSRSMTSSATRAVLAMVEHFVNSERAFVTLYNARQDAQQRGRVDLVGRFTAELAEVVKSTSYTEVIERMQRELG